MNETVDRAMISVSEAQSMIDAHLPSPVALPLPLRDALGHVLASAVKAERDHPPFDRITHDGIAIAHAALSAGRRHFPVASFAAAGAPRQVLASPQSCIEVATGAPLPQGCDTVIPYELFRLEDRTAILPETLTVELGGSLHLKGNDARKGEIVLQKGQRIGAVETALLAANGIAEPRVFRKARIGILSTGDELVEIGAKVADHQIRRSNDATLAACLRQHGFGQVETQWAPDDQSRIRACLEQLLASQDMVLITGGVSRGKHDRVPEILASLGVEELFHQVAQRPGKPLWFGRASDGKPVFGLPGNPVSCLTCLIRYAIPALRQMSGEANPVDKVTLEVSWHADERLTLFLPIRPGLIRGSVQPAPTNGSGDFTGLLGSAGFVALPPRAQGYAPGETVAFYPWAPA